MPEGVSGTVPAAAETVTSSPLEDFEGEGWRIESKGRGQFGFRRGGGYKRETLLRFYLGLDDLDEVKREQYQQNAQQQAGAKARARRARGE
jgi:hypothetical protein